MICKIILSEIGLKKILKACGVVTINNVRETLKGLAGWVIYGCYFLVRHKRKNLTK